MTKRLFTVVTVNNLKNHQLYITAATKMNDVATKRLRTRSAFRQSLMASVDESQVVEKTSLILVFHGVKAVEGGYRNVMLLYGYCPPYVRSQTSSPSFSRTVSGVCVLEEINFLIHNFARYRLMLRFYHI